jgi:hypothetical protein
MTEYTDLPRASVLYGESERTQLAISNIDAGAPMTSFVIGAPNVMGLQAVSPTGTTVMPTAVNITLEAPPSTQLMADLRAWLVQRQSDINAQLAALAVVNPPAPP